MTIKTKLITGFAIPVITLLILSLIANNSINTLLTNNEWTRHTYVVLEELEVLISSAKDLETGQRGFLITGEESYLEPYYAAINQIDKQMESVVRLTADNDSQQTHLKQLELLLQNKVAELEETIELRRNDGFEAAQSVVLSDKGKKTMDAARNIIKLMIDEELTLLKIRKTAAESSAQATKLISLLGIFFTILLVSVLGFYLTRHIVKHINEAISIADKIKSGTRDLEVNCTGTDEMGLLMQSLLGMQESIKATEIKMHESEQRTLSIVNTAVDGIITIDEMGAFISFNPAAERMFGYAHDEVIGQNINQLIPEFFHREHVQNLDNNPRTGQSEINDLCKEVAAHRKDGTTFPAEVTMSNIQPDKVDFLPVSYAI